MRDRSYRWLRVRVLGLLDLPPAGWREVTEGKGKAARTRLEPVWATRIQQALYTLGR